MMTDIDQGRTAGMIANSSRNIIDNKSTIRVMMIITTMAISVVMTRIMARRQYHL